jgi:glycogen(starch) synthase
MPTRAEAHVEPGGLVDRGPMRILFCCSEYSIVGGGFGSYVRSLAPALAARGHEVHVLSCLGGQPRRDYREGSVWIHERSKASLRLGVRRLLNGQETWERVIAGVSCWLEKARLGLTFDVIEIADFGSEGLLLGLGRRTPVVAHLHGPLRLTHRHSGARRGRDIVMADWLERRTVARADLITAPSHLVRRHLRDESWLPSGAVRIIRNPIDLDQWESVPAIGVGSRVVLAVGRIERLKGPDILLQAANKVREQVDGVEVVFIGRSSGERDGMPYRDWTRNRAAELGVPCRFIEQIPRDELRKWYAAARVVALASRYDTFPMTGLEAMASGRPVVSSTTTGVAELIAGSAAGSVAISGDVDDHAAALLPYLLDAEVARVAGERAKRLVRELCSPEHIAEAREGCYRELCRRDS